MKTYKNEQLELFPEQPRDVERLRTELRNAEFNLKTAKSTYDMTVSSIRQNISFWNARLREICIHPEIRIEPSHDYHNNIDWDHHICTTCEKELKRV